jgi:pyruvate dehydrogenase E2 component (dihydrolipoamide acetyltransferase)
MNEFRLPDLGEGMQEAEVRRWLIKPGDSVKLDQPMVEVETDKAVVEIPSPIAGRVADIRVAEGQVAKLGEVLVIFDSADGSAVPAARPSNGATRQDGTASTPTPEKSAPARSESATLQAYEMPTTEYPAKSAPVQSASGATTATAPKQRVLAAPAVRKRAFELGIDLADVPPSQPNGRVTLDDLLAYAERAKQVTAAPEPVQKPVEPAGPPAQPAAPAPAALPERQPLTGLRRRIAEHMERSWRIVPHATAFDELDGSELVALRQALRATAQQRGARLTYMPLLVKLLIPALKEFPVFNASFDEEQRAIVYKKDYHIGIATDSPEGLMVTVLRNADQLTLLQIAARLEQLIEGAQKRSLSLQEVSGSTFTLNNVGSFGGSSGTPIINYPEVAILAVGRLQEKAVVRNGTIVARTMMPLALSFDHRVIDGALAGRFLARFKELVEHPQQLILDMI